MGGGGTCTLGGGVVTLGDGVFTLGGKTRGVVSFSGVRPMMSFKTVWSGAG